MNRYWFLLLGIVLIILDQLTKHWATTQGAVFRNYHFAFSTPLPGVAMYLIYIVILAAIVIYIYARHHRFDRTEIIAWTLILAGSISNISERLVNGFVKDFIYLFSGVFNFADFYILLGIVLLFIVRNKIKTIT